MRRLVLTASLAVALLAAIAASAAVAHNDNGKGKARLDGWQETPSISTTGEGSFRARVRSDGIHYTLRYEDLESNAAVAHIHFGQRDVAGGIIAFLCGGGGKPPCPAREGTVEGVITMADIIGPANQGIAAGELREALRALRKGFVYANVHTATFGGGEIRGQVDSKNGKRDR
jgi:CHRD domain